MNKRIQTLTCTSMALLLLLTGCGQADSGAFAAEDTVTDYLVSPEKTPVEKSKGAAVETSSEAGEAATLEDTMNELIYTTPDGETGYLYIPQSVLEKPEKKVPMVLMMMCTGGEARRNAEACGWVDKALEEGIGLGSRNYRLVGLPNSTS